MDKENVLRIGGLIICNEEALKKALKGRKLSRVTLWEPVLAEGYNRMSLSDVQNPQVLHVKAIIDDKILEREFNLNSIRIVQSLLHDLHLVPTYGTLKDEDFPLVIQTYSGTNFLINFREMK